MGYVGLILNLHWARIIDFAAGWMGFDPAGTDGRKLGLWPWQVERAVTPAEENPTEPAPPRPKAVDQPEPEPKKKVEGKRVPEAQPKDELTPKTDDTKKPVTDQKVPTGRGVNPRGATQGLVKDKDIQP